MNHRSSRMLTLAVSIASALLGACGGSSTSGGSVSCGLPCTGLTYSATVSASAINFTGIAGILSGGGLQSVTLTNTGTAPLTLTGTSLSGTNTTPFSIVTSTNPCGSSLAVGTSCSISVSFSTTGSGTYIATLTIADNATAGNQTVSLSGTALGSATTANTIDCSVNSATCADTFTGAYTTANSQLATDPIAGSGFHGYADPSIRKDPNAAVTYYAYSWAKTLSDGTHVVDLHLAYSTNSGSTFTYAGPLYQSMQTTQTSSTAYSSVNDSSTETVDLIPISNNGTNGTTTLWVQAHQSYLVAPQGGIYDQLNATNLISVTAVLLTSAQEASPSAAATAMLGLSSAPEARLGAAGTDASRNITQNLAALSPTTSKCANWGQPALWYQSPTLYLALECTEFTGTGQIDANELGHFLYATTPALSTSAGADASKWTWSYVGEFATEAQAAKLGATPAENTTYTFFTEPEFVQSKSGQLLLLLTPGIFSTGQQPVIQYGCRTIPVIALSTSGIALDIDSTTSAPVVTAKVTENDLYASPNEGPAACTYEPTSINGIIMGRKFENDPTYGFYIYPLNSGINP